MSTLKWAAASRSRLNCASERSNTVTFALSNAKAIDCCPPPQARQSTSLEATSPSLPSGSSMSRAEIGSRLNAGRVNTASASTRASHLAILYLINLSIGEQFCSAIAGNLTVELTQRREFIQASPDESSYEARPARVQRFGMPPF